MSAADAAKIEGKLSNADNTPFRCAHDVSTVLHGIGPFKDLPIVTRPSSLENNISRMNTQESAWYSGKPQ